jgi:hypothetical protein
VLECFFAAPKPQQLVFGNGKECFLEIDQIRARSNALTYTDNLPIFDVLDDIIENDVPPEYQDKQEDLWFILKPESHFWFIDAGEPFDNPLAALPYLGPKWYWVDNADAIFKYGNSKSGKITLDSFKYCLKASRCMTGQRLDTYYNKIENIVSTVMFKHEYYNPLEAPDPRPFTEDEIRGEYKVLILAMQGSWTSQHKYSWSVCNARYEEDAPAAVHMWRPNADGTRRLMMRDQVLGNKTMFPIGRIALDLEHLRMFEMLQILQKMKIPPAIYGCINDCFILDKITTEEAQECCNKLTYQDGSPVFKVKEGLMPAPLCKWEYNYTHPRFSSWRAPNEDVTTVTMS